MRTLDTLSFHLIGRSMLSKEREWNESEIYWASTLLRQWGCGFLKRRELRDKRKYKKGWGFNFFPIVPWRCNFLRIRPLQLWFTRRDSSQEYRKNQPVKSSWVRADLTLVLVVLWEKQIASPYLKPLADTLVSYTAVLKHRVQYDRVSSHPANKLRFGQLAILRERWKLSDKA